MRAIWGCAGVGIRACAVGNCTSCALRERRVVNSVYSVLRKWHGRRRGIIDGRAGSPTDQGEHPGGSEGRGGGLGDN
ncbi:MAG: hypothetical protein MJE68_11660 [Proteobacteria bacterium]|nr:hypothetical protein [Pseudomonadota bacterium]